MAVLVRLCWPPVLYLRQVRVVALGLFPESCGWLSRVLSNDVHWPVISDNVWRTCPLGPPEHCCVWLRLQRSGFLWSCLVPCFYQKWCQNLVILNPLLFFFSLVVLLFALLLLEPVWGGKCRHMASSLVCESVGKACGSHVDLLSSGLCWIELERGAPLSSAQGRRGIRMEDVTACLLGNSCFCMELKHGPLPRPNADVLVWGSIPALLFPKVCVVYEMSFRLLSVIKAVHCFLTFSVASSSGSLN